MYLLLCCSDAAFFALVSCWSSFYSAWTSNYVLPITYTWNILHPLKGPIQTLTMCSCDRTLLLSGRFFKSPFFLPWSEPLPTHQSNMFTLWCGSNDSCSASSRSFHMDFKATLHPEPLLATQQGQHLCHRCAIASFCLRRGVMACGNRR